MSFYTDEFLSAKSSSFEQKKFNIGIDKNLELEVFEALNAFGIKGQVIGSEVGPCISRVYFKLDRGIRFSSIEPLSEDLKMSLRTPSIKIVSDSEKGAVAIEIPNANWAKIPFGNVFYSNHSGMVLPAVLGADPKGKPVYLDIADTPHLLIAGTTGAGKSVCLNSIITSLALNCSPADLQFLLIDPKGTEFVQYENLKNLISGKVVDDAETALNSMKWLVFEMGRRYGILKKCKCRSISEYKNKRSYGLIECDSTCFAEDMPYVVVVIDEYADLMMNSADGLQENVKKLGQKARAAGIHLILATQRPSAKVVDGDIKTNMPTRIALKVSSSADSRTILDYGGAERLFGKGDMLLKRPDRENPQRVHGCFISDDEIENAIELLPPKTLYRINEENVFDNNVHELHTLANLKIHATWGELNAVSRIILDNFSAFMENNRDAIIILDKFSEFMKNERDTIYQVSASRLGMDKFRVDVIFNDVNNAIVDPEFYQILLRLCSEHNKKIDCPFIKTVIYSSSQRLEGKKERDLFIDYILEQAFEKDDSAAMASVCFFFNVETFHLDYLKKKLDELCENGNEKAKECLLELMRKLVEYKGAAFKQLFAEAYPPLMNYLLELNREEYIIEAANYNLHIEDFIVEQACVNENWRNFAVRFFCNADYDRIVLKLAVHDVDEAIKTLCIYPPWLGLEKAFYALTEYGQKVAVNCICENFNPHSIYDECRQENLIFKNAVEGYDRAVSCVSDNYEFFQKNLIDSYELQEYVVEKAKEGNSYARNTIAENFSIDMFSDFISEMLWNPIDENIESWARSIACANLDRKNFCGFFVNDALNGGNESQRVVYENPEEILFLHYIFDEAQLGDDDAIDVVYGRLEDDSYYEFENGSYYDFDCDCFYEFILERAKVGDEYAKNVIYGQPEDSGFQEYIVEEASQGVDRAKEVILEHPEIGMYQEWICKKAISGDDDAKKIVLTNVQYDLFQKCMAELALQGDDSVRKVILENSEIIFYQKSICQMAVSGDDEAKKIVLTNVQYDLFQKCISEIASQEDASAKNVVLEHPEIGMYQEWICKKAILGDDDAKKIVLTNVQYNKFQKCISEIASQGDGNAKNVVLEHPEIGMYQEWICKKAILGDDDAKKIVLTNVQYDKFQKCISEIASQGDCNAKKVILEHSEIGMYQEWICKKAISGDEDAKKVILENPEIALYQEYICKWAALGDESAKKIVFTNVNYYLFRKCIALLAFKGDRDVQQNKDIFECMYQYYLQKISSDKRKYFGEFVRQRISKEFRICFGCDDNVLKNAIDFLKYKYPVGNLLNESCEYFVLAKAWGGNKLALEDFRSSFEFFSCVIIKCLKDADPQIRKYAMDCVKRDTTGKIIKEFAGKGDCMANEIVRNYLILCDQTRLLR